MNGSVYFIMYNVYYTGYRTPRPTADCRPTDIYWLVLVALRRAIRAIDNPSQVQKHLAECFYVLIVQYILVCRGVLSLV